MPRIPYVPEAVHGQIPDAIRARRGGSLLELDRMLLHNTAVAEGWNALLGAIRTQTRLTDAVRELAICQVAVVNEAEYEWVQHAPLAIAAGISTEVMERLRGGADAIDGLDEDQRLVVKFTNAMTRDVAVSDALSEEVQRTFGTDRYHDLVAVIATYNMVSRYLVALQVGR